MSTRTRTTVTLPDDLLAHARAVAPGGNLSAYVEHALRAQQLRDAAAAVRAWRTQALGDADTEELTDIFGEDIA
ncbi:MAG: type II toxin-antitoxin system CcdA family antitoxin [Sporichthyaceae bacterium]